MGTDLKQKRKQRYMILRDWMGRYVFVPVEWGPMDCSGIVRMAVKSWSRR